MMNKTLGFISFLLFLTATAMPQVDPQIQWKVLHTKHFDIIYDTRYQELGQLYSTFAEDAYNLTTPLFVEAPEKTVLVLNNSMDLANGYATPIPYPMIMAYTTLPSPTDSIGDYGSWGRELLIHEYTHILTTTPSRGIIKELRSVFGTIIAPNALLPTWYLEGIAVENETRLSHHGRLRSHFYNAYMRSLVDEAQLSENDIARINETGIHTWPRGDRPYLLGSYLWNEIISRKGTSAIAELTQQQSGRAPYFINTPCENLLGVNYATLLNQTYEKLETKISTQLEQVKESPGYTAGEPFILQGIESHSPLISPDGNKLLFIQRDSSHSLAVKVLKRDPQNPKPFSQIEYVETTIDEQSLPEKNSKGTDTVTGASINRASWFPDSKRFVFDQVDFFNRYYTFSDLYIYDLETKKSKQITHGLRAKEPVVYPQGERIAFIQNDAEVTRLASVNSQGDDYSVLYSPPLGNRLSRPEFLSAKEIIFSEKTTQGTELLTILDLETKQTRPILPQFSPAEFPRITPWGLIFNSYQKGVSNIYLANNSMTQARAISNVKTGSLSAELDPLTQDLYLTRFTAQGPQLFRYPSTSWQNTHINPPILANIAEDNWNADALPLQDAPTTSTTNYQSEEYSPYQYLIPRYWIPFLYYNAQSLILQASTSGQDPLGKHIYATSLGYDTKIKKPSMVFEYMYAGPIFLNASVTDQSSQLIDMQLRDQNYKLGVQFFIPGLSNSYLGALNWWNKKREIADTQIQRSGPQVSFAYSDFTMKGDQISPEKGGSWIVNYTNFLKGSSDLDYEQFFTSGNLYLSSFLPKRHALMLKGSALLSSEKIPSIYGASSSNMSFVSNLLSGDFVIRGYPNGEFMGRSLLNTNFEYRFPISYPYKGFGTLPLFLKRVSGVVLIDSLLVNGIYYDIDNKSYDRTDRKKLYLSTGGEIKYDTTIGYHLPINFFLGLYYGFDQTSGGGFSTLIGIQM